MKKLWAPWRLKYLKAAGKDKGCFFCRYLREKRDRHNFVVERTLLSLCVLNLFPYNNGHVMVAPRRHIASLEKLTSEERADVLDLLVRVKRSLNQALRPGGFNIGINEGRAAGAGVKGHLHVHVVPRWNGDTNFMPVIGETKVLAESLGSLYRKLTRERR